MRSTLPDIAAQLGTDARTLRRAAERGAVHCRRPGPRSLELAPGELTYLQRHWKLLSASDPGIPHRADVDLAVLYGSAACGSEHARSDVDVLVAFRDDAEGSTAALARRLEERIGITVDAASLSHVRQKSPLLLLQVVDEGARARRPRRELGGASPRS